MDSNPMGLNSEQTFRVWYGSLDEEDQPAAKLVHAEGIRFMDGWRRSIEFTSLIDYDDVVQETLEAFLEAKQTFDPSRSSFTSWVWKAVKRRLRNYMVRKMLTPQERSTILLSQLVGTDEEPFVPELEDAFCYVDAIFNATSSDQQWQLLKEYWEGFLSDLSQRDRDILRLKLAYMSQQKIAEVLHIKEQSVISRRLSAIHKKYEQYITGGKEGSNAE